MLNVRFPLQPLAFSLQSGQTRGHRGISNATDPMPMNEQNPGAAPVESTPLPMPYKDRSTGLIIFGILTILMGCLAALFVPLMLFGQAASAKARSEEHTSELQSLRHLVCRL